MNILLTFFLISFQYFFNEPVNILIVFDTKEGKTESFAKKVYEGANLVEGVSVKLKSVENVDLNDIVNSDAIIIGSPVYNANPSPKILDFISEWPFEKQIMKNKIGAVFVTAGGISAGEELAQMSIIQSMMVFGMIIVGGEDWKSAFGASLVTDELNLLSQKKYFNEKAINLGKRVALVTKKMG